MSRRIQIVLGAALGFLGGDLIRDLDLMSLVSFWGDRLVLPVVGSIVGAMIAPTKLRQLGAAATAILVATWCLVAFTPLSAAVVSGLARKDPLRPADAILVLGSRMQRDGDPTSAQMSRLFHGLELVKEGFSSRLVITELPPGFPRQKPFAEAAFKRFNPNAEFFALGPTSTTRDEAVLMAGFMKERGLRSVILVTAPTHSLRGALSLEALGFEVIASPAIETRFDLEALDRPEERMLAFGAAIHEQLGLFVYRRRGWIK